MDKRPQIYDPRIMKYARDKTHYGGVENPSFSSQRSNVACGDSLAIAGIIKEGKIVEIKFTGSGCMISQSAAAMLLEKVIDQSVDFAKSLTFDDMQKMLGIELGFLRKQCAELPLRILHEALATC
jgi:nitrogen fixation protein NifU and related proteins